MGRTSLDGWSCYGLPELETPCIPYTCQLEDCESLLECGPAGASILDADFELSVSGVSNTTCTSPSTGCSGINGTFLNSAPQSFAEGTCICLIGGAGSLGFCGIKASGASWAIIPPDCNHKISGNFDTGFDTTNWRVEAFLGFANVNTALVTGGAFRLQGDAGLSAVLALCGGGEVTLPFWSETSSDECLYSGATVKLKAMF